MSSTRRPAKALQQPATLAAVRAIELLRKQVEDGRALLATTNVDRLAFDTWEQTTRAVVAAAFGDPSENVSRFERASPAYPGRVGANDAFWAQYRRDELEAKVSALGSCIAQLEMNLAPATEAKAEDRHPYVDARAVLKVLHDIFLEYGNRSWSISPTKGGKDNFAHVGLDEERSRKALRLLAEKKLVEHRGIDGFVITDYGIRACDHPSLRDHELPMPGGRGDHHEPEPVVTADINGLTSLETLVENEELRAVVVRDLGELKDAIRFGLAKCTLLLGGSILEAVLVDVLDRNRALASSYMKKRRFPDEASLPDLLAIAGDAALLDSPRYLLSPTAIALARAVTDHRDLIHPHAEARGRIRVDKTTAHAIVHLLSVVVRDLNEANQRGDVQAYVEK